MKKFFRNLLATLLGMIIFGIITFLIFVIIISAIISSQDKPVVVKDNTVLFIKLDKRIVDRKPSFRFDLLNRGSAFSDVVYGLNEILACIDKAKNDNKIKGIYIEYHLVYSDYGTLDEIRNALADFRESGKFVYSYADDFDQSAYYLASISDKVFMNPEGSLNMVGIRAQLLFFKNTLEKLGVEPQIIRHGKFKSAVEPLINTKVGDENRRQIQAYVGSMWNYMVTNISASRNIEPAKINQSIDNLELIDPSRAVSARFIDSLIYRDEMIDMLKEQTGATNKKNPELIGVRDYVKVPKQRTRKGLIKEKIAVIYASGAIQDGEEYENNIGAHKISRTIREARQDSSIKAVVFRVNSGGGSALSSELIWRELELTRRVKPVIASLGDVAASGGYYIVAPADTIVSGPLTLTGSIGVFGVFIDAREFFNKKLGITSDVEKTNRYSDIGSAFRPLSAFERETLQKMVDKIYNTFVNHVAEGRSLSYEQVDKIGEGRVWSGINAKDIGLVDVFGGLNEAVKIAAEKAGLEEYRVVELPKMEDPLTQLFKSTTSEMGSRFVQKELGENYKYYKLINDLNNMNGIQARIPFELDIR
jgi:protease IV